MRRLLLSVGAVLLFLLLAGCFYLFGPTNEIDNALGLNRQSMIDCTLKWGQLAPFPQEIRDFHIKVEGNMFTRGFRGSFSAQPEIIQTWLKESPGVRDGQHETQPDGSSHHILKPGEGASYGELIVSPDQTHVSFHVYWS